MAALPGCREESPTGPEEPAVQALQTDPLAADLTADQSATNGAAAGSLGVTATRLPKSFFVNPKTGKDAGRCLRASIPPLSAFHGSPDAKRA